MSGENLLKVKAIKRVNKTILLSQSQILNGEISVLLSKYFLCEKLSKELYLHEKNDNSLNLKSLKTALKNRKIMISDDKINLLFLSSLDKSNSKSFRVIRNNICHSCSLKYRDLALDNKELYDNIIDEYLNILFEIFVL